MADIFVSYTASDRDWAFWIGKQLEALGHIPYIHEWEITAGDDIYAWMEQRHDAADRVLCVVSDEYLKAPYSSLERRAAQWQAVTKRPGFVLFVAVKPCRFPTLSDHVRRCELYDLPEEAARQRLHAFLSQPQASATAIFPGRVAAVSNVPILVPRLFVGRETALDALEAALGGDQGRVAITAVHGLRGVGKTTLAAAYAEQHRDRYRATWWLRAQTDAGLRADLVGLGLRLGWVTPDDKEEPALAATLERLRHEGEGVLLIYDNAVSAKGLRPYLPRGGAAQVLVTSNAPDWGRLAAPLPLAVWPPAVGAEYLVKRTGRAGEQDAALALAEALGGLPLAHEQAAAYCERLGVSLAEYLRRFEEAPARLLDAQADAVDDYHAEDHPDGLTVAKTFGLAIAEASRLHPGAAGLLAHAALLAPEPLPLFLFAEARGELGEPLASALAGDGLDEAVAALRAFALVEREAVSDEREAGVSTECVRLHRLVRQVAAPAERGAREEMRRALVAALATVYPRDVEDPRVWPRARRLDGLALDLVGGEAAPPSRAEVASAWLLDRLASYRQVVLAVYAAARSLLERALAIIERVRGPDHPDTAAILANLASLLRNQGDLAEARSLHERALAITERVRGPDHPNTTTSLNNLALLLQDQGDPDGARPLLERALAVRERVRGPAHPDTAASLNNLASLLRDQGDLAGALPLFKRALAVREQMLGPDHPATATSLNNLANLLQDQGDPDGARPLLERALAVRERVLGPDHPDTAASLSNLAILLRDQGDLAGARPLQERALTITERVLGPDHPDTAVIIANLALLLRDQGDMNAARPLFERALTITERVRGSDHPATAISLNNLASLLRDQGDLNAARPLQERALAISEQVLGPNHPDTAASLNNLASLLRDQGDLNAARPLYERALAITERVLGPNHPRTAASLNNLAGLLRDQGDLNAARPLYERALAITERVLGPDHPSTRNIRDGLAFVAWPAASP
ncbi:FxSxx-COOH system tetratricopeptide repeat protein [Methylobacterium sp. SyP6R]|uniref:FxSxx-COOH system tetratricopeptide repeat protein n=1 Tax=Methylobacterium sp. SyP6R TaxID=2718876 RepID=UPI001F3C8297|nr:FxSxx-COOH system tetratricopeptide repeat protein [Methylobacterium sp. SyP6R]MCF4130278.1 FxSxx-COOH system tetratricopeptide repeat protein [Methylobacterium sp. SyP6R]